MTPHQWAKEICHLANGGEVECILVVKPTNHIAHWGNIHRAGFQIFDDPRYEFRIKPERVYPVTSLTQDEVHSIYYSVADLGGYSRTFAVANAAIKRYIIDTESQS